MSAKKPTKPTKGSNRTAVVAVACAALLGALGTTAWLMRSSDAAPVQEPTTLAYFTTDTSSPEAAVKAKFAAPAASLPPIDKDGKPAVRVHIWSTDGGKTQFVSHYERYAPNAKARVEVLQRELQAQKKTPETITRMVNEDLSLNGGMELRPADSDQWLPADQIYSRIANKIQKGSQSIAVEVLPTK